MGVVAKEVEMAFLSDVETCEEKNGRYDPKTMLCSVVMKRTSDGRLEFKNNGSKIKEE